MKKFKLLSVVAVCLAAFAFTSCNTGDDTYSYLTLEQQKAYQSNMAMAGTYSDMKILWDHKNDADVKNQTDSVDTQVSISMIGDSTMTVRNFPIAKLAEHISDADLKKAISKVEPQTIKIKYMVLPNSNQSLAYIYACPSPIKLNLNYGADNKSHEVVLNFGYNAYYSGYCQWGTKQMGFPFYLYNILVDGKQTNYISNSISSGTKIVSFAIRNAWKKKSN